MKIYENIEGERDRIQNCINKFGWTSDHNLDWFIDGIMDESGRSLFTEFSDGSGLLAHQYKDNYRIWSDPLAPRGLAIECILEFGKTVLDKDAKEIWCDDVSQDLRLALAKDGDLAVGEIEYSLEWPVLDMDKYDPTIPGAYFKEIRNARNKFYREHDVKFILASDTNSEHLHKIVDEWKRVVSQKREDIYELKYHKVIDNKFRGFKTARIMIVDGKPTGINAGYEVPNHKNRFAGIIGIHDYSYGDNGTILWLEDLEWIKKAGYKEMDMQGSEDDGGLKFKMRFNPVIERKTDTFSITKK